MITMSSPTFSFSFVIYHYMSHGIILDGESKKIFRHPQGSMSKALSRNEQIQFLDAIQSGVDQEYRLMSDFRGNMNNLRVPGGSRTYYLQDDTEIDPWQSRLVVFLGVLMAMFGLIGLFLEKKLSRYH